MNQAWIPRAAAGVLLIVGFARLAAAVPSNGPTGPNVLHYSGTASDPGSGKFLYGEDHLLKFRDGRLAERVVLYTCRDGTPFARKQLTYVLPQVPEFELLDVRQGLHEGLRSVGGQRETFYRAGAGQPEITAKVPAVANLVADAGFDEFIRAHWMRLLAGEKIRLSFVVPSRGGVLEFQVRHLQSTTEAGVPAERFRLRLSNVLGLVVPGIELYYSHKEQTLLRFEGLSNLLDAAGNNYKAQIVFPPAQRSSGDEGMMQKARKARLDVCR